MAVADLAVLYGGHSPGVTQSLPPHQDTGNPVHPGPSVECRVPKDV